MKEYKGKAIYNPSGKAGEYSYWACNFYNGCSNGCEYCYCKKGVLAKTMGGNTPTLKKCFIDESHAIDIFRSEVLKNVKDLINHGVFFSFTTDPMLDSTISLTMQAMNTLVVNGIPIKVLTKRADWVNRFLSGNSPFVYNGKAVSKHDIAFGFTLTGHDELERDASTNQERIQAMKKLHNAGFKTFASIEPIIDFPSAIDMFHATYGICDLYKIGLKSGDKWRKDQIELFVKWVLTDLHSDSKVYFKDSLLKQGGIERCDLPKHCVSRDYNLFSHFNQ